MQLYARRHFLFPPLNIEEHNKRVMAVVRCEAQVWLFFHDLAFYILIVILAPVTGGTVVYTEFDNLTIYLIIFISSFFSIKCISICPLSP